jgi:hypothetical protein
MSISDIRIKIKELARVMDRRDVWALSCICCVGIGGYYIGRLDPVRADAKPIEIRMETGLTQGPIEPVATTTSLKPKSAVAPSTWPNKVATSTAAFPPSTVLERKTGKYVASKTGSKFHLPTCAGARGISEANKVWFESREEAERAGYAPAANCKGI